MIKITDFNMFSFMEYGWDLFRKWCDKNDINYDSNPWIFIYELEDI